MLVNLRFDLFHGVSEEHSAVAHGTTHLPAATLQWGEELAVYEGGLMQTHARGHITRHAEVRILVDRARDEARHVGLVQGNGKCTGERRARLCGWERALANVVRGPEAEDALGLVVSHQFLNLQDRWVHVLNVVQIRENKSLLHVKSARNDVFSILISQSMAVFQLHIGLEQELLIIGQLNHQRTVKGVLQPLREVKGNGVTKMQCFAAGPSASVEVKLLAFLIHVQQLLQVAMREEDVTSQEAVSLVAGDSLHALNEGVVNHFTAELVNKPEVVDGPLALHGPWVHHRAITARSLLVATLLILSSL
mmetsp:Transcript_19534/g.36410  ORF Transcript_19534/g.36410 Transcript_19534/m.36410 type:complete len:307 (-) Transcript_19534:576-1496(-)